MLIIPAIDIIQGKCVRLYRGDYDKLLFSYDDPASIAQSFERDGAKWLHIVDLEGAKEGRLVNLNTVRAIREKTSLKIELGGGIRSLEDIESVLSFGVDRAILGTSALRKEFLERALELYGERIAVALDSKGGKIAVEGWLRETEKDVFGFAQELGEMGVRCLIHTSILRDGSLEGANFEEIRKVREIFQGMLIASGGISSIEDLRRLKEIGVNGAIIGRALYEGKIKLKEAIELFSD